MLSDKDISVNVTLIFSVEQAILSAKSGATYVSPFIGRCEDNNIDGIDLIKSIKKVYSMNNISTNILAASIRNVPHVGQAFEVGADIVTLPPSIFEEMYKHNLTDQGIKQFDKDWKKLNS
jgi:transaldolase